VKQPLPGRQTGVEVSATWRSSGQATIRLCVVVCGQTIASAGLEPAVIGPQ
jgi:hypothetical protein